MKCKQCGMLIDSSQKNCPNCGVIVYNVDINNISDINVPTDFNIQVNNNTNSSNDIGFNRNYAHDFEQLGNNNPYDMRNNLTNKKVNNNQTSFVGADNIMNKKGKVKFSWFAIAIILFAVMIFGIFVLPILNKYNLKTYEADQYTLEYNGNWYVDEKEDKLTLYYSDNNSKFVFNAVSTFSSFGGTLKNEVGRKNLYDEFYKIWSDIDGGRLTGGTESFISLNDNSMYARIDYAIIGQDAVGSLYVIINEKYDKAISFVSYCNSSNKEKIDKDIMQMIKSLTYKKDASSSVYDKFDAEKIKEYQAAGYMSYKVPDCWILDNERTQKTQYKSNIFIFIDEMSLLEIKGLTPYDYSTSTIGTTYESMKNSVLKTYGAIKEEKTLTINGKVWYILVTPDYNASGNSYHNEIYFTMSATNQHLYYLEAYVYNDTSEKKEKYFNDSIEYIIESAALLKLNE